MIADALARVFSFGRTPPDDPQRWLSGVPTYGLPHNLQFTYDQALQLSVVWGCVDAITKGIASSHWKVYEIETERRNFLPNDPLDWLLNVRPNPEMTGIGFRESLLYQALIWGNSYAEIVKDRAGRVKELWPLISDRVFVMRDQRTNQLYYEYRSQMGGVYRLEPSEVLHIRGPSLNGLMGEELIIKAAKSIALSLSAERFALDYYANDTIVGGTLEYPGKLTKEAHENLRDEWVEFRAGPGKSHKPLILEGGMKFVQSNNDASKTQMLESRRFQIEEICRWFGVPPHKVQHLERATFNNIEHLGLEFVRDALTPWARRSEQEVDYKLFSPRAMRQTRIDTAWLSQGDAQSRANAALVWRQAGVKTANEIRSEEGMNGYEGRSGDVLVIGSGMQPLDNLLEKKSEPGAEPREVGLKPPPPKPSEGGEGAVEEAMTALFASVLMRYTRRLDNRQADLRRHKWSSERISDHMARERSSLKAWVVEECGSATRLVEKLMGVKVQEASIVRCADWVDNGLPPQEAAMELVRALRDDELQRV